jgi:TonB family protein
MLALCVIVFAAGAGAQEAPRDSGSLIKPPTIKPPTARSQNSNGRKLTTSRRGKRRARRTPSRAATMRVKGTPPAVRGAIDSADGMPNNAAKPAPSPTPTPRPKGPISGGVLNGRAISKPQPSYPPIAKAANASGTVVVQVLIDEDGKVVQAHAVSGHPLLRNAAEEAARNARFSPTQLSGQPVKVTGVITYNFVP